MNEAMPGWSSGVTAAPHRRPQDPAKTDAAGGKGAQLFRWVADLGAPYRHERSFRMTRGALLSDRFLLSIAKRHLGPDPSSRVADLCRRLGLPAPMLDQVPTNVAAASCVHFGFEGDDSGALYKVYFEFPAAQAAAEREPSSREPLLLHLAFKWDAAGARSVTTRYLWHPSLAAAEIEERISQLYLDRGAEASTRIAAEVLKLAAARVPAEKLQYLEVREEDTGRNSFDLNLYNARLQVKDLQPALSRMRDLYSIPPGEFQALYDRVKNRTAGHLAGGVHRDGKDFFNLYYGGQPDVEGAAARPGAGAAERFEYATESDPHFDYCLWEYRPPAPVADKFRAVNLLYHSFELAGMSDRAYALVDALREAIGAFQTVFGIKLRDGKLGWEFYFYDYRRRERKVSISRVLEALRPFARSPIRPNENLPYFMFSIDIDDALATGARELDLVNMYVGTSAAPSPPASPTRCGRRARPWRISISSSTPEPSSRKPRTRSSARRTSMSRRSTTTGSSGRSCANAAPSAWRTRRTTTASTFPRSTSISFCSSLDDSTIPGRSFAWWRATAPTSTICCSTSASITAWREASCAS